MKKASVPTVSGDINQAEVCPQCGAPLGPVVETRTGRKLQRCTKGVWNKETKTTEGCGYVKWIPIEPQLLDEKCPKCGSPLLLKVTRFGNRMKKCSAGGWDNETKQPTGCDYMEWVKTTVEKLDETCPDCGESLVLVVTNKGKRIKKCSTAGWDKVNKKPTGCRFVQWL